MGAVAVSVVIVSGPSLLLSDLTVHQWVGVIFLAVLAVHVWLQWSGVILRPAAPRRRRPPRRGTAAFIRATDGTREALAVAVGMTGLLLIVDLPGETLHVITGFALVPFVIGHVVRHWTWITRALSPRRPSR
jgi:hypothetical protein